MVVPACGTQGAAVFEVARVQNLVRRSVGSSRAELCHALEVGFATGFEVATSAPAPGEFHRVAEAAARLDAQRRGRRGRVVHGAMIWHADQPKTGQASNHWRPCAAIHSVHSTGPQ